MENYGNALKYQRDIAGLSQSELSRRTGIKQANISYWESGRKEPGISFCVILADYYGITLDELVGRDHGREKPVKVEYNHSTHNGNNNFR